MRMVREEEWAGVSGLGLELGRRRGELSDGVKGLRKEDDVDDNSNAN